MLGIGLPRPARASSFPPLNDPSSGEHLPGKFVWADLFTNEPAAAKKFYCGLFGWTAVTLERNERAYTLLSNGGRPVAGIVTRPASKSKRDSRWIGYIAVDDAASTLDKVKRANGKLYAPARKFPKRGTEAIIADSEGSVVGILQSTSGDPPDNEPRPGDWNSFTLIAQKPSAVAEFYRQVFGYDVKPDDRSQQQDHLLLSSSGQARAAVIPVPNRPEAQPDWIGIVRVTNIDDVVARATALGGEVLVAPRPAALGSRFAVVEDPTEGSIALVEYVDNANPSNRP